MTQLPPIILSGALLFQVTGQQLSVACDPQHPGPHPGLVRRTFPPHPPNCWAVHPGQLREAGVVLVVDQHAQGPRRAALGRSAGP